MDIIDDILSTIAAARLYWASRRYRRARDFCKDCKFLLSSECPFLSSVLMYGQIKCCEKFEWREA